MKHYQYILLDWDGNLARTLEIWSAASRTVLEKRGFTLSETEIGHSFGRTPISFKEWGVPDVEAAIAEMDAIAKRTLPGAELYPDALFVLQELKARNKQLALITSSFQDNVDHILHRHKVYDLFDAIVYGDEVTHHKPHPEPLEKALAKLGGTKDQAIMIGDSDKDMGAAANTGLDSILFYPPEHTRFYDLNGLKMFHPTHIVADFRKVLELV